MKLILVVLDLRQHIYIIVICPYAITTKLSQRYFALYFYAVFHTYLSSHQLHFKCLETTESSWLQYWAVQLQKIFMGRTLLQQRDCREGFLRAVDSKITCENGWTLLPSCFSLPHVIAISLLDYVSLSLCYMCMCFPFCYESPPYL